MVYQNTNGGTQWQVGQGQYASGGYTNNIAVSNALDQLNGTTLNNVTINGVSGLTATDIPNNVVAANYLPLAGGTLTGALVDAATASSSFAGALGIGTTSPSDLFALNGAAYLADITPPANTTNRLYSNAGSLYWAGSLIGGGSTGNWTSDGTSVWRMSGNVGIGNRTGDQTDNRTGDQHDVYSIAAWLRQADHDGSLAAFLKPVLTPSEHTVAQVEGWILGVPGSIQEPGLDQDGIQSDARH